MYEINSFETHDDLKGDSSTSDDFYHQIESFAPNDEFVGNSSRSDYVEDGRGVGRGNVMEVLEHDTSSCRIIMKDTF